MRAHILENGVVTNTIEVDSLDVIPGLIKGDIGGIGWLWDGKVLTPPPEPAAKADAQWMIVRAERDAKLAASDWTQVADAPVDDLVWAAYRQSLRDLPQTQTDPFNIVWPSTPA